MKPRVLLIDDDNDTVEVLSEFLKLKDIDVVGSGHDGKKAFELYKELKPDVVLLDVVMPYYDGFYGLEKIREIDPSAKIIMVTTDTDQDAKIHLRECGATSVVCKPHEMDSVLEIIKQIFDRKLLSPSANT